MQHDFFATRITDHPQPPYLTADHHRHTPPVRPAHGEENCEITDVNLWRSPRGTVEQTALNQLQPPDRFEVSDDHLNRNLISPRRIPVKRTGFSQPEEIVRRHLEPPFGPQAPPYQTGKILQPPLNSKDFSDTAVPESSTPKFLCRRRHMCVGTHTRDGGTSNTKAPGEALPGPIEPPVGIEPTTYSLRVNRSAD